MKAEQLRNDKAEPGEVWMTDLDIESTYYRCSVGQWDFLGFQPRIERLSDDLFAVYVNKEAYENSLRKAKAEDERKNKMSNYGTTDNHLRTPEENYIDAEYRYSGMVFDVTINTEGHDSTVCDVEAQANLICREFERDAEQLLIDLRCKMEERLNSIPDLKGHADVEVFILELVK